MFVLGGTEEDRRWGGGFGGDGEVMSVRRKSSVAMSNVRKGRRAAERQGPQDTLDLE